MIHVAYGTSNEYSKFAGTSLLSLFENHSCLPPITVHIFHADNFTQENRDRFIYLAGRYNQKIKFYNVEKLLPDVIEKFKNSFTKDSLQRYTVMSVIRLIPGQILPKEIHKIIYMDADTIVNLDINELWQIELGNKPLGAVQVEKDGYIRALSRDGFVEIDDYFNAGIMIMNLDRLREEHKKIIDAISFITEKKYPTVEQDVYNYLFSKDYIKLPRKFNFTIRYLKRFVDSPIEQKLYHYIEQGVSLGMDVRDKYNRLWFSYFMKTPWCNEDTIGNFYNGVKELYSELNAEQKNLMRMISAATSGKSRVFVTVSQSVDALKQIFYVQEGEEILLADSPNWFEKLVNNMKNSVGKKIYFMLVGEIYSQLCAGLMQLGFVEWRDFLNGEIFLPNINGVKFDSYRLIANL